MPIIDVGGTSGEDEATIDNWKELPVYEGEMSSWVAVFSLSVALKICQQSEGGLERGSGRSRTSCP